VKVTASSVGARGGRAGRARGRGRGRNGRGKPKTAEELDAEMVDYFDAVATNGNATGDAGATGGAQPAAANGDTGMDEDILVSSLHFNPIMRCTNSNTPFSKRCHMNQTGFFFFFKRLALEKGIQIDLKGKPAHN
jgi:hypothetical protein